MTQSLKKGMMAILALVMSLAICFSVGMTVAKAEEASDPAAVTAFETGVEKIVKTSYTTDLLLDTDWVEAMKLLHSDRQKLNTDYNFVKAELRTQFETAWNTVLAKPEGLIAYFASEMYLKAKNNQIFMSEYDTFANNVSLYNNYTTDANVKTYIDSTPFVLDTMDRVDARYVEIQAAIGEAVAAIDNILYADEAETGVNTYDATYNLIVLGSEGTINTATDKLDAIYGVDFSEMANVATEAKCISNYAKYSKAVEDLAKQYAKAAAVVTEIDALAKDPYFVSVDNEIVWTQKVAIEKAEASYEALDDWQYNDLKDKVTNIATLNKYSDRLDAIGGADRDFAAGEVFVVNTEIGKIGTVVYTADSLDKIEAAEALFGIKYVEATKSYELLDLSVATDLDLDIRQNDTKEDQTSFIVSGYETMIAARSAYQALKDQLDEVKAATVALGSVADEEFYSAFAAVEALWKKLDVNQKAAFNADIVEGTSITYFALYGDYQAEAMAIDAKAKPVIELIDAMDAAAPADFAVAYANAKTAYDALEEKVKPAVTNRQKLFDATSELEGAAAEWLKKVADIEANITVDKTVDPITVAVTVVNKAWVEAADVAFDALSDEMEVIVPAMYADQYKVYNVASTNLKNILKNISDITDAMGDLSNDASLALDADSNSDGITDIQDFATAVATVKADYEALSDDEKAYLQANDKNGEYENYLAALSLNERYAVEAAIQDIGTVDITKGDEIVKAEELFAAYNGTVTVRNSGDLAAARTAYNAITTKLTEWVNAVIALKNGGEVADLISVDLGAVKALADKYATFTADEQAAVINTLVVSDVKTILDQIDTQGKKVATDLDDEIEAFLTAHSTLTAGDMTAVQTLKDKYDALHSTQQALVYSYADFQVAYSKLNFTTYFGQAVAKLDKEVKENVFTAEGAVMVNILQSMYASAGTELQGLVAEDNKILTAISEKYDAAQSLVNYASLKVELEKYADDKAAELVNALKDGDVKTALDKIAAIESTMATDAELTAAIDAAKSEIAGNIATLKSDLEAAISALKTGDVKTALDKIAAIESTMATDTELANAIKALKDTEIKNLNDALSLAKSELADSIKDVSDDLDAAKIAISAEIDADIATAITALKNGDIKDINDKIASIDELYKAADAEIQASITAKYNELKGLIADLKADMEAADKAIVEKLEAAVAGLNTTITVITVILSVVCAALIGCVVYIFIKKRA